MSELISSDVVQKLKRLGAMKPRELAHRVREKLYSEVDRIGAGTVRDTSTVGEDFKAYLAGAPAGRFYCRHRESLRPFVRENFPLWIDRAIDEADRLCKHEITLLGYEPINLGPQIDWHRDPVTGRTWERRYWADYQPVQDSGSDTKIIHELNRHQHLPRLAKAYLLTGDERYAAEAVAQLDSWIDQNPPGLGINWQSSLEIAIRAISWLWTIFPLLPSKSFDEASAQRIGDSLFAQLEHVHRYTSVFSSPNTHLIGEAAALFIAGLVFQDQKRPAVWLRRGASLLTEAAEKQVLDDGVYGELSSCYHCYALDFYLQAIVLAEQNGIHFAEPVPHRVRGMLQFLMHLTRPDGTLPALGDDDGGRALALDNRDYRSFQDGLCLGAILYRRGDFKHQAGAFCEQALWMLGESAWDIYRQLESHQPLETQAYYPFAGYFVRRSGWGPLASHLVFDCGGLGMLTGAHGHADALSINLFSGGRELLVDPGTFVYNCAPEWRTYFRSTRAHNTATIDDLDQADHGGTFHWKTRIDSRAARDVSSPGVEYVEGEHDGYRRLPQGVIHRRRLLFIPPESWIVVDDFRGSGEHTFDVRYHFPADAEPQMCLFASHPVKIETTAGWISRGYGEKKPCSTLRATLAGPVPVAAMTFLLPEGPCDSTEGPAKFEDARFSLPSRDRKGVLMARCATKGDEDRRGGADALVRAGPPGPASAGLNCRRRQRGSAAGQGTHLTNGVFNRAVATRISASPCAVRQLTLAGGSGIACSYQHHGFEDIAVLSTADSEITVADFRMRGEFFWLRLEGGALKQVLAVRARSLDRGGAEVFRRSEPGPYFCVMDGRPKEKCLCAESAGS